MKRLKLRKNATLWFYDLFARFGETVMFVALVPFILVGAALPARQAKNRAKAVASADQFTASKART